MARHALVFGAGFTGARFAAALQAQGWRVTCTRREAGVGALAFGRGTPLPSRTVESVTHVLASIPPDEYGDPVLDELGELLGSLNSLKWTAYLSTTGVYGDHQGAWVDEESETRPTQARSKRRLSAERAWREWGARYGKPVQIFRLAGIYGPGRNALLRVQSGDAVRVVQPGHTVGRIHVDDIVTVLLAGIANPTAGPVFNVCDDEPAAQSDVLTEAARLLGIAPPPEVAFENAALSAMARSFYEDNRRVSNRRIKEQLGVALRYPSYREGLAALLRDAP